MGGIPSMPRVKRWTWVLGVLQVQTWFRSSISIQPEAQAGGLDIRPKVREWALSLRAGGPFGDPIATTAFSTLLSCSQFRVEHRTVSVLIGLARVLLYVGSYDNYAYIL